MTQTAARRQGYTAAVVAACFAVLLAQVAYSLPGAINGTLQQEFQTTGAELAWITAAFAIPMVVFELTTGVIGDLFGRKRLLQAGALLAVAGSLVSNLAETVQVLWAGQVVAGPGRHHGDQLHAGRARRRSGPAAGADAREPPADKEPVPAG